MKKSILMVAVLLATGFTQASESAHGSSALAPNVEKAAEKAPPAKHGAHWAYAGETGPSNWAKLSPDNYQCAGKNQSPVNLTGFIEADLRPIEFKYDTGINDVLNNGHTIQVNYAKGSSIKLDGQTFNLIQMHFHAPSENQIRGKSYPLEGHLVHADKDGNLAVIAVMYNIGAENAGLAKVWSQMPTQAGEKKPLGGKLLANDLMPATRDYYRFNGSLTTPPCSEGVRWLVLKAAGTASKGQVDAFAKLMKHGNNRPLQAANARPILE